MRIKDVAEGTIEFGFADKKGRTLGVLYRVKDEGGYPAGQDKHCSWSAFEGGIFVYVQPTRNGKWFGAWQRGVRVADMDAAFTEIARRAHGTMARYAKLFGGAS